MADGKKLPEKAIVVEFSVSMHCRACERSVAKVISKCKGVETFSTDMTKHRVVVKGRFNPDKFLKKLKKKTGKRVEVVVAKNKEAAISKSNDGVNLNSSEDGSKTSSTSLICEDWEKCKVFTMFSDENPNACSVM